MALGQLPSGGGDDEGFEGGAIFSDINITPLTDIFLVLLIIFMVGSTIAVEKIKDEAKSDNSAGLKVNLPSGEAKEIDPGRTSLVVGIQKGGEIIVEGKTLGEGDLDSLFQSTFIQNKDTQIVLRADEGVAHGFVVNVMERAKRIGLHRLAIATQSGG